MLSIQWLCVVECDMHSLKGRSLLEWEWMDEHYHREEASSVSVTFKRRHCSYMRMCFVVCRKSLLILGPRVGRKPYGDLLVVLSEW